MPRPSLKDQRTVEILDAYLTCVAQYGLNGATQERIAAQAGVARPLLRHNLGNRDQMIAALTNHVVAGFAQSTEALVEAAAMVNSPAELVDLLFADHGATDPRLMLAWQALTASVEDYPDMRAPLLDSLARFLDVIATALARMAPNADHTLVRAITQGIAAPYINLDAMAPLKPPTEWRNELKQAALILAGNLEQDV